MQVSHFGLARIAGHILVPAPRLTCTGTEELLDSLVAAIVVFALQAFLLTIGDAYAEECNAANASCWTL